MRQKKVAVLGAGLAGCAAALQLARNGVRVSLFDRHFLPVHAASLHNEGKLHLGYVYALDPEKRTQRKMMEGSLRFLGILEELTGVDRSAFTRSEPFLYAVPEGTMLSLEEVREHFRSVDADIEALLHDGGPYLDKTRSKPAEDARKAWWRPGHRFRGVEGVLSTDEIAVHPAQVADLVGAAVLAHANIDFQGNCELERAEAAEGGEYRVHYRRDGQAFGEPFDAVVNCLWEDRIRMDATVGITTPQSCLTRFKATIVFNGEYRRLPSVTFVVGAYGDVVNYKNGEYYLSWYPACKLGEAAGPDLDPLRKAYRELDQTRTVTDSIRELSKHLPAIGRFLPQAPAAKVGGGFICGWGKTDITDLESGLHRRSDIGVEAHGRWLSVHTGKYCTAPLFGREAGDILLSRL